MTEKHMKLRTPDAKWGGQGSDVLARGVSTPPSLETEDVHKCETRHGPTFHRPSIINK